MRREERVVDGEQRAARVRECCDGPDIAHEHHGVRRRLDEDELRLRAQRGLDAVEAGGVDVARLDAVAAVDLVREAHRAAVEVAPEDDVVAGR